MDLCYSQNSKTQTQNILHLFGTPYTTIYLYGTPEYDMHQQGQI